MNDEKKAALREVAKKRGRAVDDPIREVAPSTDQAPAAEPEQSEEPEWLHLALDELNRFTGRSRRKKQQTVIALVQARVDGDPISSVWKRDDTCARSTYYNSWKGDHVFSKVHENVEKLALDWQATRGLRAVRKAAEALQIYAPMAANKAFQVLMNEDDSTALRAAFGILDRAGVETAQKLDHALAGRDGGPIKTMGATVTQDASELTDDELDAVIQNLQIAIGGGIGREGEEDGPAAGDEARGGGDGPTDVDDPSPQESGAGA